MQHLISALHENWFLVLAAPVIAVALIYSPRLSRAPRGALLELAFGIVAILALIALIGTCLIRV